MCRTRTRRTTSPRTSRSESCRPWLPGLGTSRSGSWQFPSVRWRTCRPGCMTEHLTEFLQFLRLNRNASAHTVRAYESDLSQFLRHVAAASGVRRADLTPSHLDRLAIRSFLADLHK